MLERILIAVDGSDHARHAVTFGAALASAFDAEATVISVVPSGSVSTMTWIESLSMVEPRGSFGVEPALDRARTIAGRATSELAAHGCTSVDSVVDIGDPARHIVDTADRIEADAIVMGRRGTGNLTGVLLGSVSTKVSSLTDRTVVTVRSGDDWQLRHIVVPVDGSDHADRALDFAAGLSSVTDASLDVVSVVDYRGLFPLGFSGMEGVSTQEVEATLVERAEEILSDALIRAEKVTDADVSIKVLKGHTASAIVDHATATAANMICIGRRGRGNVRGLLLGSASHDVAHLADQTVVTVR